MSIVSSGRAALLAALALPTFAAAQGMRADASRLQRDIATLADDRWEGRGTGTAGNDSAAAFIVRRFGELRLTPAGSKDDAGRPGFLHRFVARPASFSHNNAPASLPTQNVVGIVPGTDAALATEFVVIGAHFDHLGRGIGNELDTDSVNAIRNGADDNASGTAGVMELARLFAAAPTKRSLVFVAFSGEELGLLGSAKFVDEALPAGRIQAMVNFDMIGRLKNDKLIIYGTGTATEMPELVARANTVRPLQVSTVPDGFGPSDHSSFYAKDIPVLHFFTDLHEDYHKATDDADKINAEGAARVLELAARAVRELADRPQPLTFVRQAPIVRAAPAAAPGARPYMGSVPDMAAGDVPGLKITGVTPGSPADKGGIKGGDLVVELDGKPVTDLETYSAALYARKAGDTISVVVVRAGQRLALSVTLGSRS
jgi:hypothetical protein